MTNQLSLIIYRAWRKAASYWIVLRRLFFILSITTLAACSTRLDNAPVREHAGLKNAADLGAAPPGYYRVKPGDTLYRIALENGQNYRDIAQWNTVQNPGQIEIGQLLRIAAPGAPGMPVIDTTSSPVTETNNLVKTQPLNGPAAASSPSSNQLPASVTAKPLVQQPEPAIAGAVPFVWPVQGVLLENFEEGKNKGINIGGVVGTSVKAAADGRVVYAGNGLRGYGNLIIIKHDNQFLTAYAHNRALLVHENDMVKKGQEIAEMGSKDADKVMLHFEVRRQGKPVDPLKYLPPQNAATQ